MAEKNLSWQSKLVLLAVLPFAGTEVVLECSWWGAHAPRVAVWTIGLSALLGLVTWVLRAATPAAAAAGALIAASLMFSTVAAPYAPWHTGLVPMVTVSLLAFAVTRLGRQKKERLGTAEGLLGRSAAQIAANLGVAAMAASSPVQNWLMDCRWLPRPVDPSSLLVLLALAALAEAAADTAASEIGQLADGRPRMITTFQAVDPGRNGAISLAGSLAGVAAAAIVAGTGVWAMGGGWMVFAVSCAGALFGLFVDSLLGATLEERGWLNNDAVNFLSTASAAGFALLLLALLPHPGVG